MIDVQQIEKEASYALTNWYKKSFKFISYDSFLEFETPFLDMHNDRIKTKKKNLLRQ